MTTYPYLITSDQHCHAWSSFSKVDADGVNSRLRIILNELERAYEVLADKSRRQQMTAFFAGDLFHKRGSIEPSVFNPTQQAIRNIHAKYPVTTYAIPGNHDLQGQNSDEIGNSMQTLGEIQGFEVTTVPELYGDVLVIPWFHDLDDLRAMLRKWADELTKLKRLSYTDVIIHAPVNGVIKGIPDHGLEAEELAAYGFRRIFAGHYHDHKTYCDGKVISVGATSHQTWNDPGTKAGFILVYEDRIEHHLSHAPNFIDINQAIADDSALDPLTLVRGNYVRWQLEDVSDKDAIKLRKELTDNGALGVNLHITKKTAVTRSGTVAKAVTKLDSAVTAYIRNDLKPDFQKEVEALSLEVLNEARA